MIARSGTTLAVIGHNGAGKSTLLRVIGGIIRPSRGEVKTVGRIGYLLQLGGGFHPDLSGTENAMLNCALHGLSYGETKERLGVIVEFSELEKSMAEPVRTYSAGMRLRLAFSIAVYTDPQVVLIDEVLAVGDVAFTAKCLAKLHQLRTEGRVLLCVSHDLGVLRELCDEAMWLDAGVCVMHGGVNETTREYASRHR